MSIDSFTATYFSGANAQTMDTIIITTCKIILSVVILGPAIEWILNKYPGLTISFILMAGIAWYIVWLNRKFWKIEKIEVRLDEQRFDIKAIQEGNTKTNQTLIVIDAKIDTKFETLDRKMDTNLETVDRKIDTKFETLDRKMDTKFETLDRKIDTNFETLDRKIDANFETLDRKIDTSFETLDRKIDTKFETLDRKIDVKFDYIDNKIDKLDLKFDGKFNVLTERVDGLEKRFDKTDEKLDRMENIMLTILESNKQLYLQHFGPSRPRLNQD